MQTKGMSVTLGNPQSKKSLRNFWIFQCYSFFTCVHTTFIDASIFDRTKSSSQQLSKEVSSCVLLYKTFNVLCQIRHLKVVLQDTFVI